MPPDLPIGPADLESRRVARNDDRGDVLAAVGSLPGYRSDRADLRDRRSRIRDERLRSVDDPLSVVQPGGRLGGAGVRPAARLREAERAQDLAPTHRYQPSLFLFFGPERVDGIGSQSDRRLERDRHRRVDPGQFLDGQAEGEEVGPLASVLLGERQAEQPHLAHLLDDVQRKLLAPVHLLGARGDDVFGELADGPAERLLFLGKVEIHGLEVSGWRRSRGASFVVRVVVPPERRGPATRGEPG